MDDFADSYLGKLRQEVGSRLLLMPGARCTVEDADGRVLLQLRGDVRLWGLPAGFSEEGESLATTLVREVREETGLTVLDPVPWGHNSEPESSTVTYPNGDRVQGFCLDFTATRWTGDLHADGHETLALEWFPLDDLPDLWWPHATVLDRFKRYRETGAFQLY